MGKKVLLLDAFNMPGGVATSFVRGRFEFEVSLHELCQYGTKENKGTVKKLFEQLGVDDKIEMVPLNETFHVLTLDDKLEYTFPIGINEFTTKMEEYVPKCRESIEKLFKLCEECEEALKYLEEHKEIDEKELKEKYPNFLVVSSYSVDKVFKALKIPKKAQEILASYWVYLGSPMSELSFVHYMMMVYSYIKNQPAIPRGRSHEISLVLLEEFEKLGGNYKFLSPVTEIIVSDNKAKGVVVNNEQKYYAKVVISNISPNVTYGKLIKQSELPKRAKQLVNARTLGARGVCVYLGLNKSVEELGLKNYSYFIYHTLNSDKEFERMKHLKGDNLVGVVLNNALNDASSKGTTILYLTSLMFSDVFDEVVTKENYFDLKNALAENMIEIFEQATGKNIRDAIEEIEIATPLTFAHYTNHPDGVIYGYMAKKLDNLLPRMMNMQNEDYIKGLFFAGGFGPRLSGYSSTYLSGDMAAKKALNYLKEEEK